MQYKVVSGTSTDSLATIVNAMLDDGWTLQGGVSIAVDQGRYEYAQALVRQI